MNVASILQFALQCSCPLGTALSDPTAPTCLEDLGEIRAFALQRTRNGTALNNIVVGTDDPALKATWTALTGAVDATHVVFLADIAEMEITGGEAREVGTGQGGVPLIKGSTPATLSAQFQQIEQDVIRSYREYQCEPELSMFMINEFGQIIGLKDAEPMVNFRGIPLKSFFVGSKVLGGYSGYDFNPVSWSFLDGWSDYLTVITPTDFDPLVEF